jgi:hypothetical protein
MPTTWNNGGPTAVIPFTTPSEADQLYRELLRLIAGAVDSIGTVTFLNMPVNHRLLLSMELYPRRVQKHLAFALLPNEDVWEPPVSQTMIVDLTTKEVASLLKSGNIEQLRRKNILPVAEITV